MKDDTMGMNIKRGPLEWNLNTLLQLITLVGMTVGMVAIWVNASRDIEEMKEWRTSHEAHHKERFAEVKASEARVDERFRSIEADMRKIPNLEYRMTVSEQSTISVVESVKELQGIVSKQGSDIRLALEILQRLEARGNGRRPDPP